MSKKVQVVFSDKQGELLEKLRGELGDTDADVVRAIVIAWLAEKSFLSTFIKKRIDQENRPQKHLETFDVNH